MCVVVRLFEFFPYVCPELVLANYRVGFNEKTEREGKKKKKNKKKKNKKKKKQKSEVVSWLCFYGCSQGPIGPTYLLCAEHVLLVGAREDGGVAAPGCRLRRVQRSDERRLEVVELASHPLRALQQQILRLREVVEEDEVWHRAVPDQPCEKRLLSYVFPMFVPSLSW